MIDGLLTVAQRAQLKDVFLNECGCETTTGKETGRLRLSGGMLESSYNFDSIHYQFIYSLLELIRDIHQTRAYVTMGGQMYYHGQTRQELRAPRKP